LHAGLQRVDLLESRHSLVLRRGHGGRQGKQCREDSGAWAESGEIAVRHLGVVSYVLSASVGDSILESRRASPFVKAELGAAIAAKPKTITGDRHGVHQADFAG
jgi:hypothetical protein